MVETIELKPIPINDIWKLTIAMFFVPLLIFLPVYFVITKKPDFIEYISFILISGFLLSIYIFLTYLYHSRARQIKIENETLFVISKIFKNKTISMKNIEKVIFKPPYLENAAEIYIIDKNQGRIIGFCPNYFLTESLLLFFNELRKYVEIPITLDQHLKALNQRKT